MPFLAPLLAAVGVGGGTAAAGAGAAGAAAAGLGAAGAAGAAGLTTAALTGGAVGGASLATGLAGLSGAGAGLTGVIGSTGAAAAAGAGAGGILGSGITAGQVGNALMAGSALTEGYGKYKSNKANSEMSKVQAKQAKMNSAYDSRRAGEESARLMGEQAARFGASGVSMEGTPLLVMADQARQSELDALAIRNQGKQAAMAYKAEAQGYKRAATNSLMGGVIKAAAYGGGAYGKYRGVYA